MLEGSAAAMRSVIDALRKERVLGKTYVIFLSDNGYLLGEHRIAGKVLPYEESSRVPLVVRGPGVPKGQTISRLVATNDVAPTITELARARRKSPVDGRFLAPLWRSRQTAWRDALMVENDLGDPSIFPSYEAVRTDRYLYVEWSTGDRELYDTASDPYQMENLYDRADSALISSLAKRLKEIRTCSGRVSCQEAEEG
jgi:N-acetylglucosamine-6-sulfatase